MNNRAIYLARRGELDLRGYEIVRVQFFNISASRSVTFSKKGINFSSACIQSLNGVEYINMLIHPKSKSLVVKPCEPDDRRMQKWAVIKNGVACSRIISGAAYIGTLYELFDWSPEYRYRFRGCVKIVDGVKSIEFDLCEPETITPEKILYPDDWDDAFGMDYYLCATSRGNDKFYESISSQFTYNIEPNIHPTALETLNENIANIMNSLTGREADNGADADS